MNTIEYDVEGKPSSNQKLPVKPAADHGKHDCIDGMNDKTRMWKWIWDRPEQEDRREERNEGKGEERDVDNK